MSTADSFILAMANQMTEDFWVGWLQKYVPENVAGGKNMQALIVGKYYLNVRKLVSGRLHAKFGFTRCGIANLSLFHNHIGPEGARLSALSLPDPHPALARAGVILAAAAARRPPACHGPQRGADNSGRRRRRRRSRHC